MQTDYSVNTMNPATLETPLTSIGLRPVGFAPTIVRDRPRARRSDSFSGARRGHDARWSSQLRSRAALLRPRGVPWPARWWSSTRPSNARRLPKAPGSAEPPSSNVPRLRCSWTRRATSASPGNVLSLGWTPPDVTRTVRSRRRGPSRGLGCAAMLPQHRRRGGIPPAPLGNRSLACHRTTAVPRLPRSRYRRRPA
jgi:hypothetical protein